MPNKTARCDISADLYEGESEVNVHFMFDSKDAASDFLEIFSKAIEAGEITVGPIKFPPARIVGEC